jgi:hypothetical protein
MEDYREEAKHLEQLFMFSRTIPGMRKYHSFIPVSSNRVRVAYYSSSTTFKEEKDTLGSNDLPIESITGFITCSSEQKWWLACVIKTIPIESCVKLTFLHPHGPSSSFKYPAHEDIRTIALNNVFIFVDPRTRFGRTYSLTRKEIQLTVEKFKEASVLVS